MTVASEIKTLTALPDIALYLLEIADDHLILGHRLSEWCGHAPNLEEDIALANIALDCIGLAKLCYEEVARLAEGEYSADYFPFFRSEREFRNCLLVEQPKGDFAVTIMRQFLFDSYAVCFFDALTKSKNVFLAALGPRALKEAQYHRRYSANWVLRLGAGTEESHRRMLNALELLWPMAMELFLNSEVAERLLVAGISKSPKDFFSSWGERVCSALHCATLLDAVDVKLACAQWGNCATGLVYAASRSGYHGEHLGHLLAEMQSVARSLPEAKW